ncbi:unnamed protein product [Sympodiomycopsis kandeliae]
MATQDPSSIGSPVGGVSARPSPRPKFDTSSLLKPFIQSLLQSLLIGTGWDRDKDRMRKTSKGISDGIKAKMLEINPSGFKYIVQVQLVENLGQGGRADLSCHWEDSDTIIQEMFSNDSLICTVCAYAIRAF